jgi:hypothetical protein
VIVPNETGGRNLPPVEKEGKMRQRNWRMIGLVILLGVFIALGGTKNATAGVEVGISIGLPPPFVIQAPPPVVVIPGTYVYLVPGIDVDILFYHGYWYRPYEGRWYWASSYNGPWGYLDIGRVPRALITLPPDYRRVPPGYRHIPYAEFRSNWGRWERERYWDRDRDWRAGWHGRPEGRGFEERGRGYEEHGRHEGRRG